MYRVLIVDDEANIITSLTENIPWQSMGLEIAASAGSMEEALLLARASHFDILVTDIKMPGGSGLELYRELAKFSQDTKCILISGHADFAYAQKAIQCGVLGYCLKPVEAWDLCLYLKKAISLLDEAQKPMLEKESLADAIAEGDTSRIAAALRDADLNPDCFYIAVSYGDSGSDTDNQICIRIRRGQYCYFTQHPFTAAKAASLLRKQRMKGLGYLTTPCRADDFANAMRQANAMALHSFISGRSEALCIHPGADQQVLARLQEVLRSQSVNQLEQFLIELRTTLPDISVNAAFRLSNQVHAFCSDPLYEDQDSGYSFDLHHLFSRYSSVYEMLDDLIRLVRKPASQPDVSFESDNLHFLQIIRYIHSHYREDLSLGSLAEVMHLNASYVSQLFSRESGTTYRKYLTELRIEKAKELLTTTNLSLSEVSEQVGFNDYFYFLKTFKKLTGISPGKYPG